MTINLSGQVQLADLVGFFSWSIVSGSTDVAVTLAALRTGLNILLYNKLNSLLTDTSIKRIPGVGRLRTIFQLF